jgi:hypothetical protein
VHIEKIFIFWGLLLLLVPLAASPRGKEWTRVDRVFAGTCVLVTFLLLAFAPRPTLGVPAAAAATFAVSAAILGGYLAAYPPARTQAVRLAILVAIMDLAAFAAIYVGDLLSFGSTLSALVLLAFTATPIVLDRAIAANSRRSAGSPSS